LQEIASWTGLDSREVGQAIRPFTSSGLGAKEGGSLVADSSAKLEEVGPEEAVIRALAQNGPASVEALQAQGLDVEAARTLAPLALPKNGFQIKSRRARYLTLTGEGLQVQQAGVQAIREVNQLTPEMLDSGEWRSVKFRPYDIELATEPRWIGKRHPLQRVIERTRQAFLEMGFEEAVSPHVESGFWDFDALFQPQDHPAREMQDTFYMKSPGRTPLPDEEMVRRVRETHENGGETGSVGWRYRWDPQ